LTIAPTAGRWHASLSRYRAFNSAAD
jgi:hypothetical protein